MGQFVDFSKIDVRLAVTDEPVADLPVMLKCREHADDTSSLAVYPDHLWCYGCRFCIRPQINALAYLLRVSASEAMKVASKYTSESLDAYRERATKRARTDPLPRGLADSYAELLWGYRGDRVQWLTDRGLKPWMIRSMNLGHDGTRFTIPFYDRTGRLITIRFRRDDAFGTEVFDPTTGEDKMLPKYSGMAGRNGIYLYPENALTNCVADTVVICEGEFDAIRLWQEQIPALSVTNGAGNLKHVPRLLPKWVRNVIIASDMDEPGQKAAWECEVAAKTLGLAVSHLTWDPAWGKDVTDLYLGGHSLYDATEIGDARFKETWAG